MDKEIEQTVVMGSFLLFIFVASNILHSLRNMLVWLRHFASEYWMALPSAPILFSFMLFRYWGRLYLSGIAETLKRWKNIEISSILDPDTCLDSTCQAEADSNISSVSWDAFEIHLHGAGSIHLLSFIVSNFRWPTDVNRISNLCFRAFLFCVR